MTARTRLLLFLIILLALALPGPSSPAMAQTTGILYYDMALDEPRKVLYGSDQNGGKIDVISTDTLQVVATIPVGAGPAGIDISPDGKELVVALPGKSQIAFINLNTRGVARSVTPDSAGWGPSTPNDVMYGRAGRLYAVGAPYNGWGFVYAIDISAAPPVQVARSTMQITGEPRIAMTADKNTLYHSEVEMIPQQISRYDVSTDALERTGKAPHGSAFVNTLCVMPDGAVYTSSGQIWTADLSTLLASYDFRPPDFLNDPNQIECLPAQQKVFLSNEKSLIVIDSTRKEIVYRYNYPYRIGVARGSAASSLLYLNTEQGIKTVRTDFRASKVVMPVVFSNSCLEMFDAFDYPSYPWYTGEDATTISGYLYGEFQVVSKQASLFLFKAPTCARDEYTVQADFRWNGEPGSDIGLAVGVNDEMARFYLISFNYDRLQYTIYYRDGQTMRYAEPPRAAVWLDRYGLNHLEVINNHDLVTFNLNGGNLIGIGNVIPGPTYAALAMAPYDDAPVADARFDNFRVTYNQQPPITTEGAQMDAPSSTPFEPIQPLWLDIITH